ncbi:MAG: glycoside hydrolase family 2 protein [Bacteroidales bacterium]|nr:glycoside hydrolase family 2 protein [Bacteroidales bacterium]
MQNVTKTVLLLMTVFMFNACQQEHAPLMKVKEINQNWSFSRADSVDWMLAQVPGCVHTDLIRNEVIEDPFYRLNEHDVQWVDKLDWVYKTTFRAGHKWLSKDRVALDFKGLDTHADVYVNGQKVLVADNMFRGWWVDVKDYLNEGENELKIYFHSPIKIGLEKYDNYPHVVHSSANDLAEIGQVPGNKWVSVHLRKAQSHFGWDWGPRLVSSGIWQPIYLKAWNDARIEDLQIVQNEITEDKATLSAAFEIESETETKAQLEILIDSKIIKSNAIVLSKGKEIYTVDFELQNPELWWTVGLGEAHLYRMEGRLITDEGIDKQSHNIGLRTVEVVREKDEYGTSLYVKLNGHPVFMKGANFIPADAFLDRVSPEKYEQIILTAKECNHNMLRVWGGGIYEKEIFYDLCDKHGILVWQDFMFACNMYPGHPEFLESVEQEAIYNIKRLRNHPSVALWCGNNEVLAAWLRWGWKEECEKEDPAGAAAQWKAYKDIFLDVLPKAVNDYDPQRFYWASSPQSGDTLGVDFVNGDDHYWGVWWGKEPFANYHSKLSRFMSEYGFQSFPEFRTVKLYTNSTDWDIYSDVMKSHQRSSIGNGTIDLYMKRDYREPKDFESFLYVGQVLQAEGMRQGMEGHRIAMPFNMGSLYWQINDCWPVASWSSSDYYTRWKAMQYFSKKAFAEVLVAPRIEEDSVRIHIVSDRLSSIQSQLNLKLIDFNGKELWTQSMDITIEANSSNSIFEISKKELLKGYNENEVLLVAECLEADQLLSSSKLYFLPVKDLTLPQPTIKHQVEKIVKGYKITLNTDKLAKNIHLEFPDVEGFFTDNYFDLIPGETVEVVFETEVEIQNVEDLLKVRTIRDTY